MSDIQIRMMNNMEGEIGFVRIPHPAGTSARAQIREAFGDELLSVRPLYCQTPQGHWCWQVWLHDDVTRGERDRRTDGFRANRDQNRHQATCADCDAVPEPGLELCYGCAKYQYE